MTDAKLNRLIAERVMGWKEMYIGGSPALGTWYAPDKGISALPNYCTDPAAWGALFVWLALHHTVSLSCKDDIFEAVVDDRNAIDLRRDPGRALVLATLAAYGVTEVEE